MKKKEKIKERFGIIIALQCFLLALLFLKYRTSIYDLMYFPIVTIAICIWGLFETK